MTECKFQVGQRVIATNPVLPDIQGRGYYGHVVTVVTPGLDNPFKVPLYWVDLSGCAGEPMSAALHRVVTGEEPFPFFEPELEAAD